jgi:hypothetical protein
MRDVYQYESLRWHRVVSGLLIVQQRAGLFEGSRLTELRPEAHQEILTCALVNIEILEKIEVTKIFKGFWSVLQILAGKIQRWYLVLSKMWEFLCQIYRPVSLDTGDEGSVAVHVEISVFAVLAKESAYR